jgi:hypothetical protein
LSALASRLLLSSRHLAPTVHRFSYWQPDTLGGIQLVWTNGFSGVFANVKAAGRGTLVGRARTSWDFPRERQTALLLLVRADQGC